MLFSQGIKDVEIRVGEAFQLAALAGHGCGLQAPQFRERHVPKYLLPREARVAMEHALIELEYPA